MTPESATPTDRELFSRIAAGDEPAFGILFYRYGPRLHAFTFGMVKDQDLAGELVQETFLRIWTRRDMLPAIENPSAWIYRICSNLALNQFRRQRVQGQLLRGLAQETMEAASSPEANLNGKELDRLIRQSAANLSPQRRRIFELSRDKGLSRRDIAAELGISENTVRNQLSAALEIIRDHIKNATGCYLPLLLLAASCPAAQNYFFG